MHLVDCTIGIMVHCLHNNVSFIRSIIFKGIITTIYDLVRHVSACIGHLQVTVKRNEVLVGISVSTVNSQKSHYALP